MAEYVIRIVGDGYDMGTVKHDAREAEDIIERFRNDASCRKIIVLAFEGDATDPSSKTEYKRIGGKMEKTLYHGIYRRG